MCFQMLHKVIKKVKLPLSPGADHSSRTRMQWPGETFIMAPVTHPADSYVEVIANPSD